MCARCYLSVTNPFVPIIVPRLWITLGMGRLAYKNQGWGQCGENPWMTRLPLWITTGSLDPTCGQLTTVHNKPDLSTSIIHGSSTGPRAVSPATTVVVHTIHRPYYNDET